MNETEGPWRAPDSAPTPGSMVALGVAVGLSSLVGVFGGVFLFGPPGLPLGLVAIGLAAMLAGLRLARDPGPLAIVPPLAIGAVTAGVQILPWWLMLPVYLHYADPQRVLIGILALTVTWGPVVWATAAIGATLGFVAARGREGGRAFAGVTAIFLVAGLVVLVALAVALAVSVLVLRGARL